IIEGSKTEDRYIFEEVAWLLLFGSLPTFGQLRLFKNVIAELRDLPQGFAEDMIMKCPSPDIMNKMASSVLALYVYDELAEEGSLENDLFQSVSLIAALPTIMVHAYQVKRHIYDHRSMYFHHTDRELSTAQNILRTSRQNKEFTEKEARLLDLCMVLQADHGGGNNSAFTTRVVTSTGTDIYSAIAAAIGSLKGPLHGGANIKVMEMLDYMKEGIKDYNDDDEVYDYLCRLLAKEVGDKSGLIYGIGHAVYTLSDPRAVILRDNLESLTAEKGLTDDFTLLHAVERIGPKAFADKKGGKDICANVDLYTGLVYRSMGLPVDLYTPLFAISRIPGWCAHRVEEKLFSNRLIRPAYKYLGEDMDYTPMRERKL
ncbi:MAG: citrate synthase, partial [Oscillospiraceae bacterium]|nr:citrate synthase [Oscillospiraceae bacterium]